MNVGAMEGTESTWGKLYKQAQTPNIDILK